jgi:hypothetical protein
MGFLPASTGPAAAQTDQEPVQLIMVKPPTAASVGIACAAYGAEEACRRNAVLPLTKAEFGRARQTSVP